jgi:hypothetical protein
MPPTTKVYTAAEKPGKRKVLKEMSHPLSARFEWASNLLE